MSAVAAVAVTCVNEAIQCVLGRGTIAIIAINIITIIITNITITIGGSNRARRGGRLGTSGHADEVEATLKHTLTRSRHCRSIANVVGGIRVVDAEAAALVFLHNLRVRGGITVVVVLNTEAAAFVLLRGQGVNRGLFAVCRGCVGGSGSGGGAISLVVSMQLLLLLLVLQGGSVSGFVG